MRRAVSRWGAALIACVVTLVAASSAAAAPDQLDPSFGSSGKVLTQTGEVSVNGSWAEGARALLADEGGYVAVGTAPDASGATLAVDVAVARYTAAGSLDTSFGANGIAKLTSGASPFAPGHELFAEAAAIAPGSGDILVAGAYETTASAGNGGEFAVLAFTPEGKLDAGFGNGGLALSGAAPAKSDISSIAVSREGGDIYVGGSDGEFGGFTIVSFEANGSENASFGSHGVETTPMGESGGVMSLAMDERYVVAAGFDGSDAAVARYTTSGTLDPGFDGGAVLTVPLGEGGAVTQYSAATAVALRSDHSIVIGGTGLYEVGGSDINCLAVAHVESSGALDTKFGEGGVGHICDGETDASGIAVGSGDGPIYLAGGTYDGSSSHFLLARFSGGGAPDTTFGSGGVVTSDPASGSSGAYAVLLDAGKPVLAGLAEPSASAPYPFYYALERYEGEPEGGEAGGGKEGAGSGETGSKGGASAAPEALPSPGFAAGAPGFANLEREPIQVGHQATGFTGFWNGPLDHFVVEWLSCAAKPPANSNQGCQTVANDGPVASISGSATLGYAFDHYTVQAGEAGKYVALEIKAVNHSGGYAVAVSEAALVPVPPANVQAPHWVFEASGQPVVGETISADPGAWSGTGPIGFEYVWLRCRADGSSCAPISPTEQNPKNTTAYVLQQADVGHRLKLRVIANGPGGSAQLDSTATTVVLAPPGGRVPSGKEPATPPSPVTGSNGQTIAISGGIDVPGEAGGGGSGSGGSSGSGGGSNGSGSGANGSIGITPPGTGPGGSGGSEAAGGLAEEPCWSWEGSRLVANPECAAGLSGGLERAGAWTPPLLASAASLRAADRHHGKHAAGHSKHRGKHAAGHGKHANVKLLGLHTEKHLTPGVHYLTLKITKKLRRRLMRYAHHGVVTVKVATLVTPAKGAHFKPFDRIGHVKLHLLPTKKKHSGGHGGKRGGHKGHGAGRHRAMRSAGQRAGAPALQR